MAAFWVGINRVHLHEKKIRCFLVLVTVLGMSACGAVRISSQDSNGKRCSK